MGGYMSFTLVDCGTMDTFDISVTNLPANIRKKIRRELQMLIKIKFPCGVCGSREIAYTGVFVSSKRETNIFLGAPPEKTMLAFYTLCKKHRPTDDGVAEALEMNLMSQSPVGGRFSH